MKKAVGVLIVLLIVIAGEGIFLCYNLYEEFDTREYGYIEGDKLLIVAEELSYSNQDLSDSTQINNALDDGGMIYIRLDNDWLDSH